MTNLDTISNETARRFTLGRQGLWLGRRWSGEAGTTEALRTVECIQMDPLNVVARSHHLALLSRVHDYQRDYLDNVMYRDRLFFDYGGNLRIFPIHELPYWRVTMRRNARTPRWAEFASANESVIKAVRAELGRRGPLGNRDFAGGKHVNSYRGRRDTSLALYYLWISGEVMLHSRDGFNRVYELRKNVVQPELDYTARVRECEAFFSRKALAFRSPCQAKTWSNWFSYFIGRDVDKAEAERWLNKMIDGGEAVALRVEGEKQVHFIPATDLPALEIVSRGGVPEAWQPIDTTTREEVTFLAPLETVTAYGRAKRLFDFEYLWEVYEPADKRRWGYYTIPILYDDILPDRIDLKFERAEATLVTKGFWLEDPRTGKDTRFAGALARGLVRLAAFLDARRVDVASLKPAVLRKMVQPAMKGYAQKARAPTAK
jgi:uncharacterized protein YcaQ